MFAKTWELDLSHKSLNRMQVSRLICPGLLVTIKICSLPVSLEELKLQIDRYSLDAKFRELEFTSLVSMPAVPQK